MRKYTLAGKDTDGKGTEWTLRESEDGEPFQVIAKAGPMTASEATEWADRQVGYCVELDWRAAGADRSVFSRAWSATAADPWDED